MKPLVATVVLAGLLVVPLGAKGPTTRIVIRDIALGTASDITDATVLSQFQVWAGRGTYSGAAGVENEGTQGFIVDWPAGIVEQRPAQLRRYELRFYVGPKRGLPASVANNAPAEELAYVVLYEHDPATGRGYVYLPGRSDEHFRLNVRSIHRRLEGHWLRASSAWQSAFMSLPAAR
jgi:hypothetical protein